MTRYYEVVVSIIVEADHATDAFDEVQLVLDATDLRRVSEYEVKWPVFLEEIEDA